MKRGFMFKAMRVIVVLGVAIVIAVLLVRLRPVAERRVPTETGLLVEVLPVRSENLNMIIEGYGTVKPREALKLVAEIRGRIVNLHSSFKEGSFIHKGRVLIRIDPRTYQLEVEKQRVQIDQAEAELKHLQQEVHNIAASIKIVKSDVVLSKAEFFRLKKLIVKNVVAQTTLDKAEQRYLASLQRLQELKNQMALTQPLKERFEAQRDMARVLLRQAEVDLEKTSIIAPFDGWVLEKSVEKGQHVNTGEYLGMVYGDGALDIEVHIPTKDLKWLFPVMAQDLLPEAKIIFSDKDISRTWKGRVARIKAQLDEKTRTLPVVVEVADDKAADENRDVVHLKSYRLRPGMFVTVRIKGKEVKQIFVLPRYVVHEGDVVYIMSDNRLKIRPVSVLRSFKDLVFVDKGLSDGDLVIKTPLSGASDGMQVRLRGPELGN